MLCLDDQYKKRGKGCGELDTTGMAHHAYTTREGPWFVPSGRNDVTIGVLRPAHEGAGPRGEGRRRAAPPADLADRVRDPVHAGRHPGRLARQAARVPGDLRAHRARQPARRVVLAVPAARRPADRARRVRRVRVRACGSPTGARSRRWTAGGSRCRCGARARACRSGAASGPRRRRRRRSCSTARAPATGGPCGPSPRTTRARSPCDGRYRKGRRWRLRWTAPDGTVRTGAQIRAYSRG